MIKMKLKMTCLLAMVKELGRMELSLSENSYKGDSMDKELKLILTDPNMSETSCMA